MANYLTYLVALITICTAIYHVRLKEATNSMRIYRLFRQTTEALATAIDAKDPYTHGHSKRVADYSVKISRIHKTRNEEPVSSGYIKRIAPRISYIEGVPEGDLPNVQIDGWRTDATEGIRLGNDGKTMISFHSRSLPIARLIWHCPFVVLYTSDNGQVTGDNFREFCLIRLDGETWLSDSHAENVIEAEQKKDFKDWNHWMEKNKEGLDINVTLIRKENTIVMETENLGISLHSKTVIHDEVNEIYAALTGDECIITDIHISASGGNG